MLAMSIRVDLAVLAELLMKMDGAHRSAAALHSRFGQVNRVLARIHAEYARDLSVEDLADTAGMSPSAFHQNFKTVTSTSPLQYLKTIRLHKARMPMVHEGLRAGVAAGRVGYESSSQFSREFKRLFGIGPLEKTARLAADARFAGAGDDGRGVAVGRAQP